MNDSITLSQKIYLLSLNAKKGGFVSAAKSGLNYTILGGLLFELFENKNIRFEGKKIVVLDKRSKNDLYRFMLEKIGKTERPIKISRALGKFNFSMKFVLKQVQQGLVEKRMIRMEPKQFLFFKWEKPYLINKQFVYKLVAEIERQISTGSASEEEMILLSFIKPSGLLFRIFPDRRKRKTAKKKLEKMMVENQVSEAVSGAIQTAQAVAVSVAASAAVAASVH